VLLALYWIPSSVEAEGLEGKGQGATEPWLQGPVQCDLIELEMNLGLASSCLFSWFLHLKAILICKGKRGQSAKQCFVSIMPG
jgi:hypothetical protein